MAPNSLLSNTSPTPSHFPSQVKVSPLSGTLISSGTSQSSLKKTDCLFPRSH